MVVDVPAALRLPQPSRSCSAHKPLVEDPAPLLLTPLLRFCLDWSEQRHHLGGALGASILASFEQSDWVTRRPADRAVTTTERGKQELGQRLGLKLSQTRNHCPLDDPSAGDLDHGRIGHR